MITVRYHDKNTLKIAIVDENKVSKVNIRLGKINAPDKIHFHKHAGEVIYADLLQEPWPIQS